MHGVGIRSRLGNLILGIVGAAYVAAALSILIYYVSMVWDGASLFDRGLQFALLVALAASAWFVAAAIANLGRLGRPHHS
jgi:hypothetical protein